MYLSGDTVSGLPYRSVSKSDDLLTVVTETISKSSGHRAAALILGLLVWFVKVAKTEVTRGEGVDVLVAPRVLRQVQNEWLSHGLRIPLAQGSGSEPSELLT